MAGPKISTDTKQTSTKGMHKRSRTGCFTCRLRRKKCDEGRSSCKACIHLGLKCDYKRPMWWSNGDQRKKQKDMIKEVIRQTKLQEKAVQQGTMTTNTPPSLCHSIPTSDTYSEEFARTRGGSMESQFDFNAPVQFTTQDVFSAGVMGPPQFPHVMQQPFGPEFQPFEVDIKTEYQTFVNDVELRRDSTMSTFSQLPSQPGHPFGEEQWVQHDLFDSRRQSLMEESVDMNFFDFNHDTLSPNHQTSIPVDEHDEYLLQHFLNEVVPLMFPMLEANQHASARQDIVLPALEKNPSYISCCLAASAVHLKTTQNIKDPQIDQDIMRHRLDTVQQLCALLTPNGDHEQALEATLAMILLQSIAGRFDNELQDIDWRTHFDQSAKGLIDNLELPQKMLDNQTGQPPFNMTLASWIDILGATMACRKPVYADTYRMQNMNGASAGLAELMGCDDKIMFVISEIVSLEAIKGVGIDDVALCNYIKMLGDNISMLEQAAGPLESAFSATGAIRPKQLSMNITKVFRIAARIYLCSLVPNFDRTEAHIVSLVNQLADAMEYIPAGALGYDRSVVWPLVIAGSVSLPDSRFRTMFMERTTLLGDNAQLGSFGRATKVLEHVWLVNDERQARGDRQGLHWREAMRQKKWDFLLI